MPTETLVTAGLDEADVAEMRRRAAVLKTKALRDAVLNSENVSIIATDEKGIIQLFNKGAERVLGYAAAEVVNQMTPAHMSDPAEAAARAVELSRESSTTITAGFEALVFKADRGIEDNYKLTYVRKDGSRFPAIVSVTALRDSDSDIIGYLLIGTDNSSRPPVEQEQRQMTDAKCAAEKANLAKTDCLSGMSHKLRTPLNAMLGFAQLMESASPPPTLLQKESIAQILQAGWHLMELVDEIPRLARLESRRPSWSPEALSLNEVMLECRTMIEQQARERGIRVTFAPVERPSFIKADRARLKEVLINLMSSAVTYSRAGGSVTATCGAGAVGRIRVSVKDSGAGLAAEKPGQPLPSFNRAGAMEGAGLGLAVTKRLVESMGGTMGVSSTVGAGSEFWVEWTAVASPRLAADDDQLPAPVGHKARDPALRTLLYVEDNPANLQLVEQIVARRPDLRLVSARNGSLGVALARTARPDVILMDINLPGMSGIKAMQILRADTATAHIPVVALSANAIPRDIERGLQAGFFRYLTKPIKVNEFWDTLDVALTFAAQEVSRRE